MPDPVALCFQEISKRGKKKKMNVLYSRTLFKRNEPIGLTTEGIFRLSGATSEVILLENRINMCSPDERKLIDPSGFDIHTLTSLVKKYLRELPEPVIPNAFHEQFQDIDFYAFDGGLEQLSAVIVKLPFCNRQLLHAILLMAAQIQNHVQVNMMSPEALATVFAPVCTGFEQSLKDHMSGNSHSTPTSSTLKKQKKHQHSTLQQSSDMIAQHIKRNKNWTNIWKAMIEYHGSLIATLDKQMYNSKESYKTNPDLTWRDHRVYYNHSPISSGGNRSLPSPFSTNGSMVPLPNDIMMAQFYPIINQGQGGAVIPVAQPSPLSAASTSETTSSNYHYQSQSIRSLSNVRQHNVIYEDSPTSNSESTCFHHTLAKKTSAFFPKSNTIRKILSASTLR